MAGFGKGAMAAPMPAPGPAMAPMAAPAPAPMPAPAPGGGGFLASLLGPQGSPERYDATMAMLKAASQGMQGSTNPLLSFLTPIATAMIGGAATKNREAAKAKSVSDMTESILGPSGSTPQAQNAMSILNNPDAPDYLKAIAKAQLTPASTTHRSGGHRSSGSGNGLTPSGGPVYGAEWWDNPVTGQTEKWGHDRHGKAVPILGPDGKVMTKGGKSALDAPSLNAGPSPAAGIDTTGPAQPGAPSSDTGPVTINGYTIKAVP